MLVQLIFSLIGNAVALLASAYFVSGFELVVDPHNWQAFAALVAVFTLLNTIIKPLLRFFVGPLVILTFGLFNIVLTGALLYILDLYSQNITITGLPALVAGTLIITAVNVLIHFIHKPKS